MNQGRDNNNEGHHKDPQDMMFVNMPEAELKQLLRKSQVFSGYSMSNPSGPIRSNYTVAIHKDGRGYSPRWIDEENNNLQTETINTKLERDSNYVHQGWSLSAIYAVSPWTDARVAQTARVIQEGSWVTQRMIIQTIAVNIPLEDLKPNPEFDAEIRTALGYSTISEKVLAVYEALARWGDGIPLVYNIGASLSLTELEHKTGPGFSWEKDMVLSKGSRLDIKGGRVKTIQQGVGAWAEQTVDTETSRVIRVIEAVSTLRLLEKSLQEGLTKLYSTIISVDQINQDLSAPGFRAWNDIRSAFKTISSVVVFSGSWVDGLALAYTDGTHSNHRGCKGGSQHEFSLLVDEHISDVITWLDGNTLSGIQFMTTNGRVSPPYGRSGGSPIFLSAPEGVLAGFSGLYRSDRVGRLQAIWRSDFVHYRASRYAEYIGGGSGWAFNDYAYGGCSYAGYVSRVDIDCGADIDGIQLTYSEVIENKLLVRQAPHHGGHGGGRRSFQLSSDEFIIGVWGAHNGTFLRGLCFRTNKGRQSELFGVNSGTQFHCQPRTNDGQEMRLCFVAGKCGSRVDGLLFVWASTAS